MVENRPERLFKQPAGKLVMQIELDFTCGLAERRKPPYAIELSERPFFQPDKHFGRKNLGVFRRKLRLNAMIADMNCRQGKRLGALMHLGAAAPGQILLVVFATINQFEHLFGRKFDQDGFLDFGHKRGSVVAKLLECLILPQHFPFGVTAQNTA